MKIPAILINNDFYSKGRNVRWIQKHGYQAVPILQCVWIASSQERECKILKEDAYCIPFLFNFPKEIVVEILESAVSVGLLDSDETHYWNSQIVSDSNRFKQKHNNYKEGHKKRLKNQDESKMNSSKIHPKSKLDFIDTDTDIEHDTDHVSDISSNKELSEPLELPPQLESPEMRQALALWQKRCIENGRPLTQATLEAQMMQLATEPIRLRNAFIFSASLSKCFNLREPPSDSTAPPKVNKSFDKAMELLAKERNGKRAGNTSNGDDRSGVPKLPDERGAVRALGKYPK